MTNIPITLTDIITVDLVKSEASDESVGNAARISFDDVPDSWKPGELAGLINFLVKNRHGSPFEHGYFKFRLEVPIAEFRDHVRHRVGHSYNEMSGRYTELEPKFYLPKHARKQHGKPGSYYFVDEPEGSAVTESMHDDMIHAYTTSWCMYQQMLRDGVAKEQARLVLPVGIFTKVIWSVNPRSLMHFIGLRSHPTAMKEIRMVSEQAEDALYRAMPITFNAFVQNDRVAP